MKVFYFPFFYFSVLRIIAASVKRIHCAGAARVSPASRQIVFNFFLLRWLLWALFLKRFFCDYPKHRRKLNAKDVVKRGRKLIFHLSVLAHSIQPAHTPLSRREENCDQMTFPCMWLRDDSDHAKWWHKSFFLGFGKGESYFCLFNFTRFFSLSFLASHPVRCAAHFTPTSVVASLFFLICQFCATLFLLSSMISPACCLMF